MSYAGRGVLVTGGAGFIGSELARQLAREGASVRVADNLATGRRENLEGLPPDRIELDVADVRDERRMARALSGVGVVFHLACLGLRHSLRCPVENLDVNARGTLLVLEAARRAGVGRFVHVSSSEVYGTAIRVPMDETHPTLPTTVYGASKLAGEACARAFQRTHGFPAVIVRPFNAYGPRSHHEGASGEVIPRFMLRRMAARPLVVFGDGEQTRDFTYVGDIARGILLAGLADGAVGETFNLGSGRETTVNELAREVAGVVGGSPSGIERQTARPGDVRRLIAATDKAREWLGFEAAVGLPQGLARLRDWYLSLDRGPEVLLEEEVVRSWEGAGGGPDGRG